MSITMNALFRRYKRGLADADYNETELNTARNRQTSNMKESRRRDLKRMNDSYASRGTAHSGVQSKNRSEYLTDYAKTRADQSQTHRRGIRDIARTRFDLENDYNEGAYMTTIDNLMRTRQLKDLGIDHSRISEIVKKYNKRMKK